MSNCQWKTALRLIREKVKDNDVYNTWFACIEYEYYDKASNTLTLVVPDEYVYKCLEHFCVPFLSQVFNNAFCPGVKLQYRIARKEASFADVVNFMKQHGKDLSYPGRMHITVPDARKRMEDGLRYFVGEEYKWLPAYDGIASWLSDNKGRGLLCIGAPGLGKTLLCTRIIPVILGDKERKIPVVTAMEMNARIDELLKEKCVIVDDLGKEDAEVKNYGNSRRPFYELCDAAERSGTLLVIATGLSTTPVTDPRYPTSIRERYGNDVLDRLRATTRAVLFEGESLRKA